MNVIKENARCFAIWGGLCFTIIVFAPIEIFLSNRSFFWFTIVDILYFAVPYFLGIFLVGLGLIVILNKYLEKFMKKIIAVIFGIAIATYVQGNFFFVNYGQLDGKNIGLQGLYL